METLISKATARDIHKLRRALETIDKAENEERPFQTKRYLEQQTNVAHLAFNGETLAIRSDILSKWTSLVDGDAQFTVDGKGDIQLRHGQASVKLCAIDQGTIPPIYPIPVSVNGTIELACDVAAILAKAQAITKNKGAAKLAAKAATERTRIAFEREQYEQAKAATAPALVTRELKAAKRLRKLRQWLRRVEKVMANPPNAFEIVESEELQMFDTEYLPEYAARFQAWSDAKRRLDNFKPRSWRSTGLEQKTKAESIARRHLSETVSAAISHHVRDFGFSHYGSFNIWHNSKVAEARRTVRRYERENFID